MTALSDDELSRELAAIAGVADRDLAFETARALLRRRAEMAADQILADEALEEMRGLRVKRTAREFAEMPRLGTVMDHVLAAEVNLLGGPSGAGKSLLARDWALSVAAGVPWRGHAVPEPRNVLWIASEGTNDFDLRWRGQPLWEAGADSVFIVDVPVNLTSKSDVDWLLSEYGSERPGLVVFDVIYGMGLPDDNGTKEVIPLLNSMKAISREWESATLALGHSGHNGERRFRGSSAWRQLSAVEWHLGEGALTCEKSKIARAESLSASYEALYPNLRWKSSKEAVADAAERMLIMQADIDSFPGDSVRNRARRLGTQLGVSEDRARKLIAKYVTGQRSDESEEGGLG